MTVPFAPPTPVQDFDDLLDRAGGGLDDVIRLAQEIVRNCRFWLPWLGAAADWMAEAITTLEEMVKEVASEIGKFFTRPGVPWALWMAGTKWIMDVGGPVSDNVGVMTPDFLGSDDKWKGVAAEAYIKTLGPQKTALEQVQSISVKVGGSLHDIALAIGGFWIATALALAKLVAELVPAAAATATPAAPAGLLAAVGSVAGFIGLWGLIITGSWTYLKNLFEENAALVEQTRNNGQFPGPPAGSWPKSTTDEMSDGSVTDGDERSAWELR